MNSPITIQDVKDMCIGNHAGVSCGQCKDGYSTVFGVILSHVSEQMHSTDSIGTLHNVSSLAKFRPYDLVAFCTADLFG